MQWFSMCGLIAQTYEMQSWSEKSLFSLQSLLAAHFLRDATATVLLSHRRVSPASETKLGKAPKDVEYVGEHPSEDALRMRCKLHDRHARCGAMEAMAASNPPCLSHAIHVRASS